MQLAETNPEMSFDTIQAELQIEENEVESFIIDGKEKLEFLNRKLVKTSFPDRIVLTVFRKRAFTSWEILNEPVLAQQRSNCCRVIEEFNKNIHSTMLHVVVH